MGLVLRQFRRTALVIIAIGLIVGANAARLLALMQHRGVDFQWPSTFTRLDPLACGILLALFLHGRLPDFRTATRVLLFAAGVVIWVSDGCWFLPSAETYMLALPLGSIGAVAIFLSAFGPAANTGWLRSNWILLYLGQISYGLYIFHNLVIVLVTQHWWKRCCSTILQFIACSTLELALTIALATLSWWHFELPFLRLKSRFLPFHLAPTN